MHPESAANCASQNRERSTGPANTSLSDLQAGFLAQKKQANELTR
jgi:hypothetical protein